MATNFMRGTINWVLADNGELFVILSRTDMPARNICGRDGDIILRGSKEQFQDNQDAIRIIDMLNDRLMRATNHEVCSLCGESGERLDLHHSEEDCQRNQFLNRDNERIAWMQVNRSAAVRIIQDTCMFETDDLRRAIDEKMREYA